jgi:hypothetical protein
MSLRLIVVCAIALASAVLASDPRIDEAFRLAGRGETGAARAQLQTIHDELQASGVPTSAALHYNLGTLALTDDDIADAVLHLLAASRRDPWDDDIRHNLEVALSRRADQVSGPGTRPLGARLPPGPVRLAWGATLAIWGIASALTLAGSRRVAPLGRALLGPAVVGALVASLLMWLRHDADAAEVAVIVGDAEARAQPDARATGFTAHAGLTGTVIAEQDGFARLRLENGLDVWVTQSSLRRVP